MSKLMIVGGVVVVLGLVGVFAASGKSNKVEAVNTVPELKSVPVAQVKAPASKPVEPKPVESKPVKIGKKHFVSLMGEAYRLTEADFHTRHQGKTYEIEGVIVSSLPKQDDDGKWRCFSRDDNIQTAVIWEFNSQPRIGRVGQHVRIKGLVLGKMTIEEGDKVGYKAVLMADCEVIE